MTTTRKSVSKETEKNEKVIYVGPTLSAGRLAFATIYIGGLPEHINAIVAEKKSISIKAKQTDYLPTTGFTKTGGRPLKS